MARKKVYYRSKALGEIEESNARLDLFNDSSKEYWAGLSDEQVGSTKQLIAGLESRKLIETVNEGENIQRIYSSNLSPKISAKNIGYTEPPKMAEVYQKLNAEFYKVFNDVITGKTQSGSTLIKNVISLNEEINHQIITHYSTKNVTSFDRAFESANKLRDAMNTVGKEFGFFDIETIGGRNEHGFQELDEITEFAYLGYQMNEDKSYSNINRYASAIGLIDDAEGFKGTKYNNIKNEIDGLRDTPRSRWTERQKILVDSYSRYGHSDSRINPVKGTNEALWNVENLATEGDGIGQIDTALKGLDVRKKIGDAQRRAADANGGVYAHQQQYDAMISKIASEEVITSGHNVLEFDVPILNRNAAVNGGQSIDTAKAALYDLLPSMRFVGQEKGKDFYYKGNKDWLKNITSIKDLTINQQESITKIMFGEGEMHSAVSDTEQFARLFLPNKDGKTLFDNVLSELGNIGKSNANNRIQYKYEGTNKQLFYITNSELFGNYNSKNALNMVMDPVSKQYRTFNGYAINPDTGVAEKELFNQTGTMRPRSLATFEVMRYDSTDELIKLLNPENKADVTIPEMATKEGYVLAVSSFYDKEMAKQLGIPYDASMNRKTLYFHDTYDSLMGQLNNAAPIANAAENGAWNPIEENLKKEEMQMFNLIGGRVTNVTPGTAREHFDEFRKLHVEKYTNEAAAEQARKLTYDKYNDIYNAFIKGKSSKAEVMESITKLAEAVSKGIPLTQDVQLQTTLGFIQGGNYKLYSETINKTANLAGYLYDQQPIFDEILSQIDKLDYMKGDSAEAKANRTSAFMTTYNDVLEHLSKDPNAIKNGKPTNIVGRSQLDYINIQTRDLSDKISHNIGTSIVGADKGYTKIPLSGGLIRSLKEARNSSASPKDLKGSEGYALLSQFVDSLNNTEEYKGAVNFNKNELHAFANTNSEEFETAILGQLKSFVNKKRDTDISFGYAGETNMTQMVTNPLELAKGAFDSNRKLIPEVRQVIGESVRSNPRTFKLYNAEEGITGLTELLTKRMVPFSKDEYAKSLAGLDSQDVETALFNFDLSYKAIQNYAKNISEGIYYNPEFNLSVGEDNLFISRNNRSELLKLPQLRNTSGLLYAQIDNTNNALFPFLNINKAITEEGLNLANIGYESSFDRGISYSLNSYLSAAYMNDRDPMNAFLGWLKNTKQGIREKSPSFQSINPRIREEYRHQDVTELINAIPYLADDTIQDLVHQGLLPKNFVENLERKNGRLVESTKELGSKGLMTFGPYKQVLLTALSESSYIKDKNVKRMLKLASDAAKETDVAEAKIGTAGMVNIGGGEFSNPNRPLMYQTLDSVQYRKDLVEEKLKASGIDKYVTFGSVLNNPKSKFLSSATDETTGYEMVNTISGKFLSLDQNAFNKMLVNEHEKADNAFMRAAAKVAQGSEQAQVADEIYDQMKTLNLHEQELLMSTKLTEAAHYKSQIQTISSKKKMMVQFQKNLETQEAVETYNKLVPVINKDGTIVYTLGMKIKEKQKIFTVEGYDQVQKYGAKYDGVVRYGFYNDYDELIDAADVNKLISDKSFTDIGQIEDFLENKYNIKSKYSVSPKSMQRPKIITSGAEKGVNDYLYMGAGRFNKSISDKLDKEDRNIALSDDYLDFLQSTDKLSAGDVETVKRERHLLGDVLEDLLDTENTGILGIQSQNIPKHGNSNVMLESIVGLIRDEGKLDNEEVRGHLKEAFNGVAEIRNGEVFFSENASGKLINVKELNLAAKAAGLTFYDNDGKMMYGKTHEMNGVRGTILYGSLTHDSDWGGGTSANTDYDEINEKLRGLKETLGKRQAYLNDSETPHTQEQIDFVSNQVNDLEKQIMDLEDKKDISKSIEKGAVYSDRLDQVLNARQYDNDTIDTIKSKLSNKEFNKYYGHALDAEGNLTDEYKYKSILSNWTDQIKEQIFNGGTRPDGKLTEEGKKRNREVRDTIDEIGYGAQSMGYNDAKHRKYDVDDMVEKGFEIVGFNESVSAKAGQGRETILNNNNIYTHNMMLDLGQDFGEDRYIATSKDTVRYSGDTIIKTSRKEKLDALRTAMDTYGNPLTLEAKEKARQKVLRARQEYIDLEKLNITGKNGKLQDILKIRLNNSHIGKVSMLPIMLGEDYNELESSASKLGQLSEHNSSILSKSEFGGKSVLQHYSEGKVIDVQYKNEKALRDMGYFDKSTMRKVLGEDVTDDKLEEGMKDWMRTKGDVVMTQRFPIIMEGSAKPSMLYLADSVQDDQTNIIGASAASMKADVDGDTIMSTRMMAKNGDSYMNYLAAKERGEAIDPDLENMVNGQRAYMMDRAVNQNAAFENQVQNALIKDADNTFIDISSVGKDDIIDGNLYASLDGVTNITRAQALNDVKVSKKYVDAARQKLGKSATTENMHAEVVRAIQEENKGNTELINGLIHSYAISTRYEKFMTEETAKHLKGTTGEINLINKRIREAYFLTADRTAERYSSNTSIVQNVLNVVEETAAISAKKAEGSVDPARIQQWRDMSDDVFYGRNVQTNIQGMKTWLSDNMRDKFSEKIEITRNSSNLYKNLTEGLDKEQSVDRYISDFGDIMNSMAGNKGIQKLSDGYFGLGDKLKGISAQQVMNVGVSEDDNTIKGMAVKMLNERMGFGHILNRKEFEARDGINSFDSYLADGREWLKDEKTTGQTIKAVLQSTGEAFGKIAKGFDGKTLAMGALGLAGAYMIAGFVGGNPSKPADTQAMGDEQFNKDNKDNRSNEVPSLLDQNLQYSQGKQPGYVINVNAKTAHDKQYVSDVINQATSRSFNTNVNIAMNITDDKGNINDRYIEHLLAGVV